MSVSIRISDDTAEELKSVQPDGMSLSKMCDTLLKLTLRKIKTDKENDCILGNGKVENMLLMTPGKVLIVLPEDAHMVKVQNGTAVEAKKAVMKIKVN